MHLLWAWMRKWKKRTKLRGQCKTENLEIKMWVFRVHERELRAYKEGIQGLREGIRGFRESIKGLQDSILGIKSGDSELPYQWYITVIVICKGLLKYNTGDIGRAEILLKETYINYHIYTQTKETSKAIRIHNLFMCIDNSITKGEADGDDH